MKSVRMSVKRTIVGAAAIAAFAVIGPTLSLAQETTTTTTATEEEEVVAVTTEEKICEAQQRTEARWQKFLADGTPEEFGSEEPFTFDPTKC